MTVGLLSQQAEREFITRIHALLVADKTEKAKVPVSQSGIVPRKILLNEWGISANTLNEFERNGLKSSQPNGEKGVKFYRLEELQRFFKKYEV